MRSSGRLSPNADVEQLHDSLERLQVPCPWGEFPRTFSGERIPPIPYAPLGLELGCNGRLSGLNLFSRVSEYGYEISSDVFPAGYHSPPDYVQMDLRDSNSIHLWGFRAHVIASSMVFTYDILGVNFGSREEELSTASKLNDLLMPGGIFCAVSGIYRRFEGILQQTFAFRLIDETGFVMRLQKPF